MSAIFSGGGGVATELDPVFSATGITAPLIANWNTAFGWGNHASAGYLLSATAANTYQPIDGDLTAIGGLSGTSGLLRKTAANTWALDTNTYLTSFTETDPVFTASPAFGVTSQKITNWDTAFGWGNHASAGYQSALGFTPLNRAGDSISATNGSGFIGYPSQSGTPSTPSSGFRFYANASHALSWVGQNGFTRTFDGTANTANRAYTLPNASGTIALEGTLTSLANPTIQNGAYQFVQNTKPTQRAVGVPLVAGDRWYKTDDQTEWSWNGTYWLSPPVNLSTNGIYTGTTTTVLGNSVPSFPIGSSISNGTFNNFLYVHWRGITYSAASPLWNSNNRWGIAFREFLIDQTQLLVLDAQIPVPPDLDSYFLKGYSGSVTINNDIQNFSFGVYFNAGTPSAIRLNHIVVFSYIYP